MTTRSVVLFLMGVFCVLVATAAAQEPQTPLQPAMDWVKALPRELDALDKQPIRWAGEGEPVWLRNDRLKERPGWRNHHDLPVWAQRGKVNFARHVGGYYRSRQLFVEAVEAGLTHAHGPEGGYCDKTFPDEVVAYLKQQGFPVGMRAEGAMFFGFDDNARNHLSGYRAYHCYPHNINWFRKYPSLMMGTAYSREGHTLTEYSGSSWVERYLGALPSPHFRAFRKLYLQGFVTDTPVFAGEQTPGMLVKADAIWLDNPMPTVASWDPYTVAAAQKQFEAWFGRPIYDPAAHPHPLVRRAWRHYSARAISDYYRWNKAQLRRLAGRLVTQSANLHTQYAFSTWEMWLMNQGAMDFMDNEEATHYGGSNWTQSPRYFMGYKMGLAAGNGRAVLRHFGEIASKAESLACLCSSASVPRRKTDKTAIPPWLALMNRFLLRHQAIYGNAQPGAPTAVLFHMRRSLESAQVPKLVLLGHQLQRMGLAFEVVTEDDLTEAALSIYDTLIVSGVPLIEREVAVLKAFCQRGGRLVLIGDNRAGFTDTPLTAALGGPKEWADGEFAVGKGRVVTFERQFAPQERLAKALRSDAAAFLARPDDDLLLTMTYQPVDDERFAGVSKPFGEKDRAYPHFDVPKRAGNLLALHVVNYSGQRKKNIEIRVPAGLARRLPHAALLRPDFVAEPLRVASHNVHAALSVKDVGPYAVVVLCASEADRDRLVQAERASWLRTRPELAGWKAVPGAARPWQDQSDRRGVCLLTACSESPRAGFLGRFTYPRAARPGQAFDVRLDSIVHHPWGSPAVHEAALVFRRASDDTEVRIPVKELEGKRVRDLAKDEAVIRIRATLPEPGRWQSHWHYRLVDPVFDGTLGPTLMKRPYTLDGEPRVAIPYHVRLERFVVTVGEPAAKTEGANAAPGLVAAARGQDARDTRGQDARDTRGDGVSAVWCHGFAEDYPFLDGQWQGITAASDGNTYFAVSTHTPDHHAQLFRYDPRRRAVEHLADVGQVVHAPADKTPQGKIHTPIFEHDGALYMGTLHGRYSPADEKNYPGGHFLRYDLKTGKTTDLGRPAPGCGFFTMTFDPARGRLYAIAFPGHHSEQAHHGLAYDIATKRFTKLGVWEPPGERTARCLFCDPRGRVWGTIRGGQFYRYDPKVGKRELLDLHLPWPDAAKGVDPKADRIARNRLMRAAVRDPKTGDYYVLGRCTELLSRLDVEKERITPLADLGQWGGRRKRYPRPSTLAFVRRGRTIYYAPWGQGRDTDLVSYDIDTGRATHHGPLRAGGQRVVELHSLVVGSDGKLHGVAFVYAAPGSAAAKIRRTMGGRPYDMRFIVIDPPGGDAPATPTRQPADANAP